MQRCKYLSESLRKQKQKEEEAQTEQESQKDSTEAISESEN